jgi:hypothetical protein
MAPDFCGSSVRNFLHVTPLAPSSLGGDIRRLKDLCTLPKKLSDKHDFIFDYEYIPSPDCFKAGFNSVYYYSDIRVKLQERKGFKICCRHICVTDVRHSIMDFFFQEMMDRTSFIHIDPILPS